MDTKRKCFQILRKGQKCNGENFEIHADANGVYIRCINCGANYDISELVERG